MNNPYNIIKTVMITEKSTELSDHDKYCLKVNTKARKPEIKRAVETIFPNVKVSSVNVINMKGKKKRMRTASYGKRPDWKKAIVTLSEGSIELV